MMVNFKGKKVLITGGTGSFGRTFVTRLLEEDSSEIRIFSRDEEKQDQMRSDYSDPRLSYFIGNVRDYQSVRRATEGMDLLFHAAALKQVPSCEFFPAEAIATNCLGSQNVARAANDAGLESSVFLSTDKAVFPVNAMGMSKALMEKIVRSQARSLEGNGSRICITRYGNVLYSRGSVVPRFINQIMQGRELTVTDGSMTRFLFKMSDAIDLVLVALAEGENGDIFIRKASACSIDVLVTAVKEIFNASNSVKYIGFRHGEKLYETLATAEELSEADDMGDFWRIKMDCRFLDYESYFNVGTDKPLREDFTSHNTVQLDVEEVKQVLLSLPEIQTALQ